MKSISKNMIISIFTRIITLITGLIVQEKILSVYGSSLNGLTSSITQVMSYLVLLEAGLGTASIQALYNPLSLEKWSKVSGIITATEKEYRKIAVTFFICLILASFLLPLAVKGQIELVIAGLLTFITGGSYIISYIIGGKYKVLLIADRKLYILNTLDMCSIVLSCILRVWALNRGMGIVTVQVVNLICVVIKNIGYFLYVKNKYDKINYQENPDLFAISKRWNVLVHTLSGIIVNHTDIMILTIFSNLKLVSVYSVYNLVFSQLSTTIQSTFLTAPQANFGQLFNNDKDKFEKVYGIYETAFIILLFIVVSVTLIMILPFVFIYTKNVSDIKYLNIYLPILFALILLFSQIRVPVIMIINIAGTYRETQNGAIAESAINLIVSLVLFFGTSLGLYGLLIGTICSYMYRTTDVIIFTYKNILKRKITLFLKNIIINFILMIILYIVFNIFWPLNVDSYTMWIIKSCLISIICCFVYIIGNYIFNKEEIILLIKFSIKKLKGEN